MWALRLFFSASVGGRTTPRVRAPLIVVIVREAQLATQRRQRADLQVELGHVPLKRGGGQRRLDGVNPHVPQVVVVQVVEAGVVQVAFAHHRKVALASRLLVVDCDGLADE